MPIARSSVLWGHVLTLPVSNAWKLFVRCCQTSLREMKYGALRGSAMAVEDTVIHTLSAHLHGDSNFPKK